MKMSVSRGRNFRHGIALAFLTLPAISSVAQQQKPAVPFGAFVGVIGTSLEVQRTNEAAPVDVNSVSSVKSRLQQLQAAAKLSAATKGTAKKTVKVFKPSFDGQMKQMTIEKHRVPGAGWAGAQLYYLQQRAFPFDRIDPDALTRAAKQRDQMTDAKLLRTPKAPQNKPKGQKNEGAFFAAPPPGGGVGGGGIIGPPIISDSGEDTSPLVWEKMGPGGYNGGSLSWRIGGLEYDPFDPETLYAATPKGGVWKTNDSGNSWRPLTDKEFGLSFSSVAVSPFDNNVVFAGTGDYDGGNGPGYGILKSIDGGQTWTNYGKVEFSTASIRHILPHPQWPNIVFATGARNGLFRSIDEGETWTKVLDAGAGSVSNVVFNSNLGRMYASVDDVGIFFSTNDGQTWAVMPGAPTGTGRFDVATSKLGSKRKIKTLYVIHAGAGASGNGTISKGEPPIDNVDGDIQFTALADAPHDTFGGRPIWDQQWYNFYIGTSYATVRDPGLPAATPPLLPYFVNQDVIYVGLLDVWVSQDSGVLWQRIATNHTDQHSITVSPFDPTEILLGSDGGVRKIHFTAKNEPFHTSQPNPESIPNRPPTPVWFPFPKYSSWFETTHNNGLDIAQFYDAGFSPLNSSEGLGGTQDNGTQFTTNLDWTLVTGGDGGGCGIDTANPLIQYSSSQIQKGPDFYPINLTLDGWESGFDISIFTNGDINPFIANGTINAGKPNKFMYATNFIYEFDSDTFTWRKFRQRFSTNGYVIATAAAPSNGNYIYAGTSDGLFYYSANGGTSFTRIDQQGQGGLPQRAITDVAVDYTDPKKVFVTVSGTGTRHVYRCDNVTSRRPAWVSIGGLPDIYTNAIEILNRPNPSKPGKLEMFVGTDIGVFYTDDSGSNWYNASRTMGLPTVDVRDITYRPSTGYLHIATYGRGMWRLPLGDTAVGAGQILLRIQTNLDSYRGDKTQLTAKIECLSGNVVVKNASVRLSAAGYIIAPVDLAGTFDIRVTIPGFLRRRANDVYVGEPNQPATEMSFVAGDVNGDNSITIADWQQVVPFLGQQRNGIEDVDGDRQITSNDLRIIQKNLGKVGDN